MKKVVLVLFIIVSVCWLSLFAVEEKNEENPAIKDLPGFWYVCMEFTGQQNDSKRINQFFEEFRKQGLRPTGPSIGVYYNSTPEVTPEELKWEFGITVAKGTVVKGPLKMVEFLPKTAAVYLHKGPYDQLSKMVEMTVQFTQIKGFICGWPISQKYLNSPAKVKPEELMTEIVIPAKLPNSAE